MENARKPLWLLTEENIAKSKGIYQDYWLAFKQRHPEFYDVAGAQKWENPYNPSHLRAREVVTPVQPKPKKVCKPLTCKRCNSTWAPRSKEPPIQCPRCHSPYWNRDRVF